MTLDDLRQLAERLPAGASVTLPADELRALFASAPSREPTPPPETADDLLTAAETARMLHVSTRWVYDHGKQLGVRRLSRRCTRFSRRAVERYASRRAA